MTAFMLCGAVLLILVELIYFFFCEKPYAVRLQNAVYAFLGAVYLVICAPLYQSLTEQTLYNQSETYGYIFMFALTVISFLPVCVLQMAQAFRKFPLKFVHFWGLLILYAALLAGLIVNCLFFNESFGYLIIFVPLHFVFFVFILGGTVLDVSDKKQYISELCINGVLSAGVLTLLLMSVWGDFADGSVTNASYIMIAASLLLCLSSLMLPVFGRRAEKIGMRGSK